MEILKQSDTQSATAEAGEYLNLFLTEHKKQPILLMLSGGSALSIVDYIGPTALAENLTVTMLDERFSTDPEINNFLQLQKTDFYKDAFEAEASFFGTLPRPAETMEELRARWNKNLKMWHEENPKGLIVATLGMGTDGHTSGILPFPEAPDKFERLFNGKDWTVQYNAEGKNKYPDRVTTTLTFLKNIDFGFALVCGKDKAPKFEQLKSATAQMAELPALIWEKMKNVKIFTDLD
jgi:6-phosphogluconolactonase/glucosamine-6-phosphate isomerase/deaminase